MKPKTLISAIPALFLLASLVKVPLAAPAAETLINFDDVADGTLINTHYAGVTFTNPIGGNIVARSGLGSAPSAPNVVCITNGGVLPFFDSPFGAVDARFATPVRVVKIDARPVSQVADHLDPTVARPYLQAFDAGGTLLATVYYAGALPQGCCYEVGATQTLTYASPSANIARARFSSQQPVSGVHTYGMFDNLRFDDGYYTLTVNIVGGGYVLTSPLGPYFYGSIVSLTASPFVDWAFSGWSGDINTTLNPVLPIMDGNKTITATFVTTPQTGPNFVVTTTDDHDDGVAGVSDCTLREAINAANANADASIITFAPNVTGVITLQLGQLTINQNLNILGPGATVLAVSGNNSSRVFNALSGNILISDLCVTNGRVNGFVGNTGTTPGGTGGPGGGAFGGGIYCQTTMTLSNCWITGCSVVGGSGGPGGADTGGFGGNGGPGGVAYGGGVSHFGGTATMTMVQCTLSGNTSTGGTGGAGATATDFGSGVPGNGGAGTAGIGGGAVIASGTLALINCTVTGNTTSGGAGGRGGDAFPDENGGAGGAGGTGTGGGLENLNFVVLANCTISSNNALGGVGGLGGLGAGIGANGANGATGSASGGGVHTPTTLNLVQNDLIAGNSSATDPDCSGAFASQGYNLVSVAGGATGFTGVGDQTGTSGSPLNALLGPLHFYGGSVPTMQLLPGSPAIDKGKSATPTDARGRLRPYDFPTFANATGGNGSDIGAYEVNPPVLSIAKSSGSVVLSWSTNEVGFALESAAQLASPTTWTIVPGNPPIVGNQFQVTINSPTGKNFYRLIEVGIANIPGLFNTGVGPGGSLLVSGTVDPHWRLIQSADAGFPGPNAIVVNDAGFPIPPWLANGPASKWIAPQASQAIGNQAGDYKYRITFDLTGLDPSTAIINGFWSSDNGGPQVLLNGTSTGYLSDGNFTALGNAFTINTGFIAGVNTLDFLVTNGGPGINPTGVRVELSGIANRQPPP